MNTDKVVKTYKYRIYPNQEQRDLFSKTFGSTSWGIFSQYLQYKAKASNHCQIILMDQYFPSSHICHCCNTRLSFKLSLKDRSWVCPTCSTINDRDINAAQVILIAGLDCHKDMPVNSHLGLARSFKDLVISGIFRE